MNGQRFGKATPGGRRTRGRFLVALLIALSAALASGALTMPAHAKKDGTERPFKAHTVGTLVVPAGSNVLLQVGSSISGAFHATHLGTGSFSVIKDDPRYPGAYDIDPVSRTFKYRILGVSTVANRDELGWGSAGSGTYTTQCPTSAPGCKIEITMVYDYIFGTGRFEDASGLIGEKIEIVWYSSDGTNTTLSCVYRTCRQHRSRSWHRRSNSCG